MFDISVLMLTYNSASFITEAIDSILAQTFRNFELLIIDDGSTDDTVRIIRKYTDERIKLHCLEHNYIASLNYGLLNAKGKYIARFDSDDKMHPDRLKLQYTVMEDEHSIDICCSWMTLYGEKVPVGEIARSYLGFVKHPLIELFKQNIVFHPTVMIRRTFLEKNRLCYMNYPHAEDYKLWFEAAKCGAIFYVISYPLVSYRVSDNQISQKNKIQQDDTSSLIRKEIAEYLISNSDDTRTLFDYYSIMSTLLKNKYISKKEYIDSIYSLFINNTNLFKKKKDEKD